MEQIQNKLVNAHYKLIVAALFSLNKKQCRQALAQLDEDVRARFEADLVKMGSRKEG